MLINSTTADAIIAGQREGLRQINHHGGDKGPCASGDPAAIWCFLDRGMVRFALITKDHPRPNKYANHENAHIIWRAPS